MNNTPHTMTNSEVSQLIERFLLAQTTEAEEQALADYFQSAESVPEEWQPVRELLLSFQTDAYDLTDAELAAMETEPAAPRRKIAPLYWFAAAAACAALLFIIGNTLLYNNVREQKLVGNGQRPVSNLQPTPKVIDHKIASLSDNEVKSPQNLKTIKPQRHKPTAVNEQSDSELLAVNETELPIADEQQETASEIIEPQLAMVNEPEPKMVVCSETDMPVTNPQNLIYTEEDIQKLQEIYRQRIIAQYQNDIEISRHNLRQLKQFLASN